MLVTVEVERRVVEPEPVAEPVPTGPAGEEALETVAVTNSVEYSVEVWWMVVVMVDLADPEPTV